MQHCFLQLVVILWRLHEVARQQDPVQDIADANAEESHGNDHGNHEAIREHHPDLHH